MFRSSSIFCDFSVISLSLLSRRLGMCGCVLDVGLLMKFQKTSLGFDVDSSLLNLALCSRFLCCKYFCNFLFALLNKFLSLR